MIMDSVFSHLAHHRGQLTVYLRLNEASVPALYGPSADEGLSFGGRTPRLKPGSCRVTFLRWRKLTVMCFSG